MANIQNSLQIGTVLKGGGGQEYSIAEVLGQGSFGIAYRAKTKSKITTQGPLGAIETEADVDVAIKEFFIKEMNSRGSNERSVTGSDGEAYGKYLKHFRREAMNLQHIGGRHNTVKVIDLFNANNTSYYVMEYLSGGTLDDRIDIKRGGHPLKEAEALHMTERIGNALNYLHANHMLHLDLKPGNIMLRNNGEPVLIDFGMAKQFDDNGDPLSSSTLGNGTKGYAPTEQADYMPDSKTFPATIDVYALGATMYKMLCGVRPPEASVVLNDGLPMQPLIDAGVSSKTRSVVEKAMSPLRKNRYQSVAELMNALGMKVESIESVVISEQDVTPDDENTQQGDLSKPDNESESTPPWFLKASLMTLGFASLIAFFIMLPGVFWSLGLIREDGWTFVEAYGKGDQPAALLCLTFAIFDCLIIILRKKWLYYSIMIITFTIILIPLIGNEFQEFQVFSLGAIGGCILIGILLFFICKQSKEPEPSLKKMKVASIYIISIWLGIAILLPLPVGLVDGWSNRIYSRGISGINARVNNSPYYGSNYIEEMELNGFKKKQLNKWYVRLLNKYQKNVHKYDKYSIGDIGDFEELYVKYLVFLLDYDPILYEKYYNKAYSLFGESIDSAIYERLGAEPEIVEEVCE